jgi:hypothetical protein
LVDVANELFAITASVVRAERLTRAKDPRAASAIELGRGFSLGSRARIREALAGLWRNHDAARYALAQAVLEGRHRWIEETGAAPAAPTPVRTVLDEHSDHAA